MTVSGFIVNDYNAYGRLDSGQVYKTLTLSCYTQPRGVAVAC